MTLAEEAHAMVQGRARALMSVSDAELRVLISAPRTLTVVIGEKEFDVTEWAEERADRRSLAVIVEARRNPLSWLAWSQVMAFGFFVAPDGSTAEFQEGDYYAHGY